MGFTTGAPRRDLPAVAGKTKTSQSDQQQMICSLRARLGDGFLLKFRPR
jgi:hypothetical protein